MEQGNTAKIFAFLHTHFEYKGKTYHCTQVQDWEHSVRFTLTTDKGEIEVAYRNVDRFLESAVIVKPAPTADEIANMKATQVAIQDHAVRADPLTQFMEKENEAAKTSNDHLLNMMEKLSGDNGAEFVNRANALANLVDKQTRLALGKLRIAIEVKKMQQGNQSKEPGKEGSENKKS